MLINARFFVIDPFTARPSSPKRRRDEVFGEAARAERPLPPTMASPFALGVSAAATAPFVMTLGFIFWDNHWRGSTFSLNLFKCNLASVAFLIASLSTRPRPFPAHVFSPTNVGFLLLSSGLGIVVGDLLWLEGLRLLGARRVILVDAVKPFFSALLGWAVLGERFRAPAYAGMVMTVVGVLVVSFERAPAGKAVVDGGIDVQVVVGDVDAGVDVGGVGDVVVPVALEAGDVAARRPRCGAGVESGRLPIEGAGVSSERCEVAAASSDTNKQGSIREVRMKSASSFRRGYVMAVLNVGFDSYGSVLTKQFGAGMTTWEISFIRFGFAGVVMLCVSVACSAHRRYQVWGENCAAARNLNGAAHVPVERSAAPWYMLPRDMSRVSWAMTVVGVALVTFLTPALTNYALFQIALALALTLGSIGPLYALPLSWLLQKDKPSVRACGGSVLAVAGVAVLSAFGTLD